MQSEPLVFKRMVQGLDAYIMKQIFQSLKTGITEVVEAPCPVAGTGQLLVRTSRTLISAGTERMLVDFGRAGFVGKARQQPDRVRDVFEKVTTDGLQPTLEAVLSKLDQPLALGYCNVGTVLEAGVTGFRPGDRVVSNGKHAEVVAIPANLAAHVPDAVNDDEAAFAVLGAVALQGIRLVQPTLGEVVVVSGLGLIGLLTVQLLRAHGCRVLGIDFDKNRLELAERFGARTVDLTKKVDPWPLPKPSRAAGGSTPLSSRPRQRAASPCAKRLGCAASAVASCLSG